MRLVQPTTTRFFALHGTPGVLAHRHIASAWEISESYRLMALGWALADYLDLQGIGPAPAPEIPVAGYREPCRTRAFRDPAPEALPDGSALLWVSWVLTPRIAAQLARVGDGLSHRMEEALLSASYGFWLDPQYPAPPLDLSTDGTVVDLRVLRPVRHRRLRTWRAMGAIPEARLARA